MKSVRITQVKNRQERILVRQGQTINGEEPVRKVQKKKRKGNSRKMQGYLHSAQLAAGAPCPQSAPRVRGESIWGGGVECGSVKEEQGERASRGFLHGE